MAVYTELLITCCYRVDAPSDEAYHPVRLLLPDVVVLLLSSVTYGVLKRLYRAVTLADSGLVTQSTGKSGVLKKYIETFGELTIFLLLGGCGSTLC